MKKVAFAVVGVRNFAAEHIKQLSLLAEEGLGELKAVVITDMDKNKAKAQELADRGITIYQSYSELLEKGKGTIDVITLPTSIHTHYQMALDGMRAGYNLVLEKPPVPTVQQMDELIKVENETGVFCSIGFQQIHAQTIQRLKQMIVAGDFGEIKEIACRGYWSRNIAYYNRNPWAGKVVFAGQLVMDGPIHNALAHYLNNMIFLAGSEQHKSAELAWVRAELYRSRPFITSDDTSCLEAETTTGTKIYFYTTHSPRVELDPIIEIIGTKARATWDYSQRTHVKFTNGEELTFDNDGVDPWYEVMRTAAQLVRGELEQPYSTLENSRSFVVAINGAYDSAKVIRPIPEEYVDWISEGDDRRAVVRDIEDLFGEAFEKRVLLSDLNKVPWAAATPKVSVRDYKEFNPFGVQEVIL